jgi:hypothetical protein
MSWIDALRYRGQQFLPVLVLRKLPRPPSPTPILSTFPSPTKEKEGSWKPRQAIGEFFPLSSSGNTTGKLVCGMQHGSLVPTQHFFLTPVPTLPPNLMPVLPTAFCFNGLS